MADIGTDYGLGCAEVISYGMQPAVAVLYWVAHHHVVHHPAQVVRVAVTLVAQRGKAVAFALEEAAVGRYAVQSAGVFAYNMSVLGALVKAVAIDGLLFFAEAVAYHYFNRLRGDGLHAVYHAAVAKAAIVARHVVRGALYAGACAERGQYAPAVVRNALAVYFFKKAGDIAVGSYLPGFGAVYVKHSPRHAYGPEHALVKELLKRHASCRVNYIGYNGVAFVGIAHVFARRAKGLILAVGNVIYNLLNFVHLVGGRAAHLQRPAVAFVRGGVYVLTNSLLARIGETIGAVHGDGPFQRLHGRYAGGVHGKVPYQHRVRGVAGYAEGGNVLGHGIVIAELAFGFQYCKRQSGGGLAHAGYAENGVFVNQLGVFIVAEAVAFFEYNAVGAVYRAAHAGQLLLLYPCVKRLIQRLQVVVHWCSFLLL